MGKRKENYHGERTQYSVSWMEDKKHKTSKLPSSLAFNKVKRKHTQSLGRSVRVEVNCLGSRVCDTYVTLDQKALVRPGK